MKTTTSRLRLPLSPSARAAQACVPMRITPAAESVAAARKKSRRAITLGRASSPAYADLSTGITLQFEVDGCRGLTRFAAVRSVVVAMADHQRQPHAFGLD